MTRRPIAPALVVAAAAAALASPAAAAAPTVQMMVVGKTRVLLAARSVTLRSHTVAIGRRHCAAPSGTALAGLLDAGAKPRVTDVAGCDPASLFVTKVGPDANRGFAGWQYKVGHSSPSRGAGDPGGRLRRGQRLLWFWCVRASACERTLEVTLSGTRAKVVGYDDNGRGTAIAGAVLHVDGAQQITTAGDGTAQLPAVASGRHTVYATKSGMVQSFPVGFGAAP
jgi:hypothetical protein